MPFPISTARMIGASAFGKAAAGHESGTRKTMVTTTMRMVPAEIWGTVVSFAPSFANLVTTPRGARQARSRCKRWRREFASFYRAGQEKKKGGQPAENLAVGTTMAVYLCRLNHPNAA